MEQCRLVEYLNEHFKENGYNSFCSYSSSEGENRLPQSGLLMYLLQICRFYRSDIIILGCTDRKLFSEFKSYDIIISDYDRNSFETGTYDAKFIGYPVVNTVDIFDTILRHFQ